MNSGSPPRSLASAPVRRRAARAFTLLETMMATFIMALGISTSIIAMQQGYKFLDTSRGTTLASQIIQSEIERIRMMSWANVTALPASQTFDGATYFSAATTLQGDYSMTRTMALDSTRSSDVALITISVNWKTYDGRRQTRRFQTKYMKNGLYDYYYTLARP